MKLLRELESGAITVRVVHRETLVIQLPEAVLEKLLGFRPIGRRSASVNNILRITKDVHGILAFFHAPDLLVELLAKQHDRNVGAAEHLLATIDNRTLCNPHDGVLRQDVIKNRLSLFVNGRWDIPRDGVLRRRLHTGWSGVDLVTDVIGVGIVGRHADLVFAARRAGFSSLCEERKNHRRVFLGVVVIGAELLGIADALGEAVRCFFGVKLLDANAGFQARMQRVVGAGRTLREPPLLFEHILKQMTVRPGAVGRVTGVFLALQPVAGNFHNADLAHSVRPYEQIPTRQGRRRQRSHICKHQTTQLPNWVGLQRLLDLALRLSLHWPLQAFAGVAVEPAVIGATQAVIVRDAELQIDQAMQASVADQA